MYGQFHNEQTLRKPSTRSMTATKNVLLKSDDRKMKALTLMSLLLITLSISSSCFAGPSTPRLPKGNGNAQGR